MMLFQIWSWLNSHLLVAIAFGITLFLIYHYFVEKDQGVKLSRKYRNSVFETQSKIFLNATQYLISGNKDLAIREFLNAVDLNNETLDTYFALGGLFRSNGEIEKAISIHRSLIGREDISESVRVRSLKELALDFDKGGFLDKAIETYKDVLKVNRDQIEVIASLCRIYEDLGDWDQAYRYRIMLSKVGLKNQAETISHILVQKAKGHFDSHNLSACSEELAEAFRFFPSVSGKILQLKLFLALGDIDQSKGLLIEVLKEHPMYASFLFESLAEQGGGKEDEVYRTNFEKLREFFLFIEDRELLSFPSVILTRIRLLKEAKKVGQAFEILREWMGKNIENSEALKIEYIKLAIALGKKDEALKETSSILENFHKTLTKHFCQQCGYNSDNIFWRCPQCHDWETIQFTWKV
jgi:lipopolysaccharide assembly protein B